MQRNNINICKYWQDAQPYIFKIQEKRKETAEIMGNRDMCKNTDMNLRK